MARVLLSPDSLAALFSSQSVASTILARASAETLSASGLRRLGKYPIGSGETWLAGMPDSQDSSNSGALIKSGSQSASSSASAANNDLLTHGSNDRWRTRSPRIAELLADW